MRGLRLGDLHLVRFLVEAVCTFRRPSTRSAGGARPERVRAVRRFAPLEGARNWAGSEPVGIYTAARIDIISVHDTLLWVLSCSMVERH